MTSYLDVRTLAVRISARKGSETGAKETGQIPQLPEVQETGNGGTDWLTLQQKVRGFVCHSGGKLSRTRLSREASRIGAVCSLAH